MLAADGAASANSAIFASSRRSVNSQLQSAIFAYQPSPVVKGSRELRRVRPNAPIWENRTSQVFSDMVRETPARSPSSKNGSSVPLQLLGMHPPLSLWRVRESRDDEYHFTLFPVISKGMAALFSCLGLF